MHEAALAHTIVELIRERARAAPIKHVKVVHLTLGALAEVEADALSFGFVTAARGTVVEGATLQIERVPGDAVCAECGARRPLESQHEPCGACGCVELSITGTHELVTEVEVS